MTTWRDPDATLAAWLDAGPVTLPEPTRRAIAVGVRATRPRVRPGSIVRRETTPRLLATTLAAAAVLVAIGLVTLVPVDDRRSAPVGTAPMVPTSSPGASGAPSELTRPFESLNHAYTARYPDSWSVTIGQAAWSSSDGWGPLPLADRFSSADLAQSIWVASTVLPDGVPGEDWIADKLRPRRSGSCRVGGGTMMGLGPESWDAYAIGGRAALVRSACSFIDGVVIVDRRVWVVTYRGPSFYDKAPSDAWATFRDFTDTISFASPDSVSTPMASAFTSSGHRYSALYPDGWTVRPATEEWTSGTPWLGNESWAPGAKADRFTSPGPNDWVWVASTVIPEDASVDEWLASALPPRRLPNGRCVATTYALVGQPSEEWRPTVVGLRPGVRRSACGFIDGLVVIDHRAWVISYRGAAPPDSVAPGGRAIFDAFAAAIEFVPDSVPEPELAVGGRAGQVSKYSGAQRRARR